MTTELLPATTSQTMPALPSPQPPGPPTGNSKAPPRPRRWRSGTAAWHMSARAVDISAGDIYRMTNREALDFLVEARWGSRESIRCPRCGTTSTHYWRPQDQRWKCRGCRKIFSVTTGTVFADRKLPLQELIAGTLLWVNCAGGQSALQLRRNWNTTYNSAYVMQHKLREGLVRGYNVGLMGGDIEIDGSHQSGWGAAGKRGNPKGKRRTALPEDLTDEEIEALLNPKKPKQPRGGSGKTGAIDPDFKRRLDKDRRIVLVMRKRSGVKGRGAVETRVAVGLVENQDLVEAALWDFVACHESYLNTDEARVFSDLADQFRGHRSVTHSLMLRGPNGENNNLAEELNARLDRLEKGSHLNIEPKYVLDYAVETAFRGDTRRMSNGAQLKLVLHIALNVGESRFWRGFTQGRHRTVELLHPRPRAARASGPRKGRSPFAASSGRRPR